MAGHSEADSVGKKTADAESTLFDTILESIQLLLVGAGVLVVGAFGLLYDFPLEEAVPLIVASWGGAILIELVYFKWLRS